MEEVFNIKIEVESLEITLTILPVEAYYKVIYYGGELGAIRLTADQSAWEKVPDEEVEAGDLPLYKHDPTADRLDIVLDENTIPLIGEEIKNA